MANKMPELREGLGRTPTEAETQDRSVLVCTPFCQHLGKIWRGETSKSTKRLRKRTDKSTAEITFRRVVQKSFTILSLEDRGHLTYSWALREPLLASSSSPLPASGREEKISLIRLWERTTIKMSSVSAQVLGDRGQPTAFQGVCAADCSINADTLTLQS